VKKMKKVILLFLIVSIALSGCGYVSESSLDEVLQRDPSFKKLLDSKKRLSAKIAALEDKKQRLDTEILLLRQETNPDIQKLEAKLEKTRSEYDFKKKSLKDSISSLKNIRRLLDRKSKLLLTGDEISVWNKRIANLEKEIDSTRIKLDKLKSQARLIKTEIKILKK